eukprot:1159747-Pelagomonas_calceolata.AAC.3
MLVLACDHRQAHPPFCAVLLTALCGHKTVGKRNFHFAQRFSRLVLVQDSRQAHLQYHVVFQQLMLAQDHRQAHPPLRAALLIALWAQDCRQAHLPFHAALFTACAGTRLQASRPSTLCNPFYSLPWHILLE